MNEVGEDNHVKILDDVDEEIVLLARVKGTNKDINQDKTIVTVTAFMLIGPK